jgi:hypothetical protein
MRAVPVNLVPFVVWSQQHADLWRRHAPQIGVQPAEAEGFAESTDALVAARAAEEAAKRALTYATDQRRQIEALARKRAALIIAEVRVHAERAGQGNPSAAERVYALAGIDAPREASPLPAPETPWIAGTKMNSSTGHLTLRLGARQPRNSRGTMYQATRLWTGASGQSRREGLPLTATRTLVDATLPAGPREVQYELRAIRSGQESPAAIVTVRLAA